MKRQAKTTLVPTVTSQAKVPEAPANGTPSGVRSISSPKHQEIKWKVLTVRDGLLRKLAEHDRSR